MHKFLLQRTIAFCIALLFLNGCSMPDLPVIIQEIPADRNEPENREDPKNEDSSENTSPDKSEELPEQCPESCPGIDPENANPGEDTTPEDEPVDILPGKEDSQDPVIPEKEPEAVDPGIGPEDPKTDDSDKADPEAPETGDPGKADPEDPETGGPGKATPEDPKTDGPEEPPVQAPVIGAGDLATYLGKLPDNTKANPYSVRVSGFDLSSSEKSGNTLWALYGSLSRYVSLDLSACTGDSFANIAKKEAPNKEKIVSLTLPKTVDTIKGNTFSDYTALVSVKLPGVTTIEKGAFANFANLKSIDLPLVKTLGGGETAPKEGVFYNCLALTEVCFPEAITIGDYAFDACKSLIVFSMPKAKTLGNYALKGCESLVSVSLPEASSIGNQAFHGCIKLSSLFLPSAVSIGKEICYNCPLLESVTLGDRPPVLEGLLFPKSNLKATICVPKAAIADYETAEGWAELKSKLTGI